MSASDVPLERALALAADAAPALGREMVPLERAAGRILAAPVRAGNDLPSADCAAMDGVAVRSADTPGTLRLVGESQAGGPAAGSVGAGQAIFISTGARLGAGADAVVRRELIEIQGDGVRVAEVAPGRDVRRQGEVIRSGDVLIEGGLRLGASAIGAIGAVGHAAVPCLARACVAIVATGSELIPLGAPLAPGAVYDSSRAGLAAQLEAAGARVIASASVADDLKETRMALAAALALEPDVLVTAGGISVGRHDHVRPALAELGARTIFARVQAVACRPTWLGRIGARPILGLPGNPVSAAVGMHLFGRVLIGLADDWRRRAPLAVAVSPHRERVQLLRCAAGENGLEPRPNQGSHAITSLVGVDALAWIPPGSRPLPAGTWVAWSPFP